MEKYEELKKIISGYGEAAVAFSGGCDSTFLLYVCREVLGDRVTAVTNSGAQIPRRDLEAARRFCRERGIRHVVEDMGESQVEGFRANGPDRCYHCKRTLFAGIKDRYPVVFEGSNADDDRDYRPGARAVKELGIISPLKEAGFTKAEIREMSRKLGLDTWDKPASACLASRIPYGEEIEPGKLRRIDEAENFIRDMGIPRVRVRAHGDVARIEVDRDDMRTVLAAGQVIYGRLRELGFEYATLDLLGYRMGSLNEVLK